MKALMESRAFIAGVLVALGLGIVALAISNMVDLSAKDTYKTESVRL
jgi:hypothetical protein